MPLPIYRLRVLLAMTAAVLLVAVTAMYIYARLRVRDVRKDVGNKLGIEISKTANGFQISKSDGKRTQFTVQASDVKQFKLNGNAELHNVNIVLYGRDSSRFDQVYGDDFSLDQKSGDITAKGEVQIDLLANPEGSASPDQSAPKEVKNPIHLRTRDLIFNKNSGDAATDARVDFSTPQATGWAVGVRYAGKSNTLTLLSHVHVRMNGPNGAVIEAEHGLVTNDPRVIVLDHPRLDRENQTENQVMTADRATLYLGQDNNVERIIATDHVEAEARAAAKEGEAARAPIHARADEAEFLFTDQRDRLRTGILTGHVHVEQASPQPVEGDAGRVILDYAGENELQMVHALDGARLFEKGVQRDGLAASNKSSGAQNPAMTSGPQDFELTAPVIDFKVIGGNALASAVTSGPPQITISPATHQADAPGEKALNEGTLGQKTVVMAGKFTAQFAQFDGKSSLKTVHGAPDARIVNSNPGQPDRVSTSEMLDAIFLPQGGIDSLTQQGDVAFTDNQPTDKRTQAWADKGRYTPADQMLVLTGNPRVASGSMTTTADIVRMNRATDDASAESNVKSTYSDLKEQPDGALLASSSPIHVTARSMTAHKTPGIALYTGNARLWQDANIVEAPSIHFDRDRRFVTAQGTAAQPAKTVLVQADKAQTEKAQTDKTQTDKTQTDKTQPAKEAANPGAQTASKNSAASKPQANKGTVGKSRSESANENPLDQASPIAITALKLTYADAERKVHYEGGVFAKGADFEARSQTADAYLVPRSQSAQNQSLAGPSQLDHIVADGDVVITQPKRRADGQKLVYTAADDKFVLTGSPGGQLPSIFDAEQGKITGVSLTFFRTDDRVLVEGEASTPVVTPTRVAQ